MKSLFVLMLAAAASAASPAFGQTLLAAGTPPALAADGPAANLRGDYRLRLGDKLRIEVHKDPQLSQSVQIRPDGKITLPLVGDIAAIGLTPSELREDLVRELTEYIARPVVTVIVVEAMAPVVYVLGEVARPGAVTMQNEELTVLQAIALAGGLREFADRRRIRVLRRSPVGNTAIEFDYRSATRGDRAPMYLRPGDTVVVPD